MQSSVAFFILSESCPWFHHFYCVLLQSFLSYEGPAGFAFPCSSCVLNIWSSSRSFLDPSVCSHPSCPHSSILVLLRPFQWISSLLDRYIVNLLIATQPDCRQCKYGKAFMKPSNLRMSADCLLISHPRIWTWNWPGSQLFSAVGEKCMKPAVCLLAKTQMDLCYCQCNSHLLPSSSATTEVIPGCYSIAEPQVWNKIIWNWTNYFVWCPSFTFAGWCSKCCFTSSLCYCCYLEGAPQAGPPRAQRLLEEHHKDLWQA